MRAIMYLKIHKTLSFECYACKIPMNSYGKTTSIVTRGVNPLVGTGIVVLAHSYGDKTMLSRMLAILRQNIDHVLCARRVNNYTLRIR